MSTIYSPIIVYNPSRRERPRIVTFKIEPEKLHEIDTLAVNLGLTRSELIREALEYYIQVIREGATTLKNPGYHQ